MHIEVFDDKGFLVVIAAPGALPIALALITVTDILLKRIKYLRERTDIFFGIELTISLLLFYPVLGLGYRALGIIAPILEW
ncbi:hypothetical protein [Gracilimonas tropica]|uniref:hypothetical protein n=1 Tax=Gracilimonas tropica TaxID=454600 RepID=UPI000372FAB8|nr:hypothetical protein [Gracilimonas tropica]